MIGRHATLNGKDCLSYEEKFLLERLNIPKQWLFSAKATLALSFSRYFSYRWIFYILINFLKVKK